MKGSTFKRAFILIVLAVVVISIPKLMKPILASPSSLVKSVKLVRLSKPNDNPFTKTPIVVYDDDTIRIQGSNYYVNFDWEKLAGDTVNAGDSFKIDVSGGMIIAETTTPHPLTVTSSTNPSTVYPSIGTIEVNNTTVDNHITSHITVTFNDKVNSNEIKALGDIRGTVYLLSTLNLNNPDIQPPEGALPSWEPIIHPKIEVLDEPTKTSTVSVVSDDYSFSMDDWSYRNGDDTDFINEWRLYPGRTYDTKTTLKAPYNLKMKINKLVINYNDFVLDLLKSGVNRSQSGTLVDAPPIIDGKISSASDYIYTITKPSGLARTLDNLNDRTLQEQRNNAIATSVVDLKNTTFTNDDIDVVFTFNLSGSFFRSNQSNPLDNTFSKRITLLSGVEVEYENILIDQAFTKTEGIGNAKKGNIEIKYVYVDPNNNQSTEVLPKVLISDVLVGSTTYNNYVMPDADKAKLLEKGYVFLSSPATVVIEENKTIPLEVRVNKAYVDITLKYEYTDNTGTKTYPLPNAIINNAWIKDPALADYKLTAAQQKVLDDAGYELSGSINLNVTSLDPADNIFTVPIKLKGAVVTTTSGNTTSTNTTSTNTTSTNTTSTNTTSTNTTSTNTTSTNTTSTNTTSTNTTSTNTTSTKTTSTNTTSYNTTSSNTTTYRTTYSSNTSYSYYGGGGGGGERPSYNTRRDSSNTSSSSTTNYVTAAPVTTANWPNTSIVWPSEPPKTTSSEVTTNPPTFEPPMPTTIPRTSGEVINTEMEYTPTPTNTAVANSTNKANPVTGDNAPLIKIVVISLLATILVVLIKGFKPNKNYK